MTENPIQVWFRAIASGVGFTPRGSIAHRHTNELIQVIELQRSRYGRIYYVNVGIALKSLGATNLPREEQCHIRVRLTNLVADRADELTRCLDLEQPIDPAQRISQLEAIAGEPLREFSTKTSGMEGLRAIYRSGVLRGAFVHRLARAELERPGC